MKNINIRMSYDTTADIAKIVEDTVEKLYSGSMIYKEPAIHGVEDLPLTYRRGWAYRAAAAFEIEGYHADGSSYFVEIGDLLVANNSVTRNAFEPLDWDVYQGNIEVAVDDKYTDIIDGNF